MGINYSNFNVFVDFRFSDIFRRKLGLLNVAKSDEMLVQSLLWVKLASCNSFMCNPIDHFSF